jgi:hypothetical protein
LETTGLLSTRNAKAHVSLGPENGREGVDEENVPLPLIEIGSADALAARSIASRLVRTDLSTKLHRSAGPLLRSSGKGKQTIEKEDN